MMIAENLSNVRERIRLACEAAGRAPDDVKLLAVSKTKPAVLINEARAAGQVDFGENYLQDALAKMPEVAGAHWHFIGPIQSRKTRDIATHFDWVHSLASEKVARRLNDARAEVGRRLRCLVQVNIGDEASKSGVGPAEALNLVRAASDYEYLELVGLMAIPPAAADAAQQRMHFAGLAGIRDDIAEKLSMPGFNELSMGMSGDLESAIMEGATWVRVGTDIFGART